MTVGCQDRAARAGETVIVTFAIIGVVTAIIAKIQYEGRGASRDSSLTVGSVGKDMFALIAEIIAVSVEAGIIAIIIIGVLALIRSEVETRRQAGLVCA